MIPMHLSEELLAQFDSAKNNEKFFVECAGSAAAVAIDELQPAELSVVTAYNDAAGAPPITNGKPTAIRMVAWMAHGDGAINGNRVAFVSEEIKPFVSQVNDTNPLVMDFNHSAVRPMAPEYPKMIGAWTRAEWAFNPDAADKKGAWGILMSGVMMAWLFPDIADTILADQARNGYTRNSMACMSRGIEFKSDANGPYQVLHNPVFFTLSVLDVPPADSAALGKAVEGSNDPNLETTLKKQLCDQMADNAVLAEQLPAATQEVVMTEEEINALKAEKAAADAQVVALTLKADELDAVQARLVEVETARDAVAGELEKANEEIERLSTELQTASDALAGFESVANEAARQERIAARIASLPESYREAHSKKTDDARARVETKWAAMSDEEWELYKVDELSIGLGTFKVGYVARSDEEGHLPRGGGEDSSIAKRVKAHKK